MPVIEQLIDAGNNDARQQEVTNAMQLSSSIIELRASVTAGVRTFGGFRWVLPFNIPLGSTIDVAYIELAGGPSFSHDVSVFIRFELATSPPPFSLTTDDIEGRTLTSVSTPWFDTFGVSTAYQQSPDIMVPLQELVDNFSPNALVCILEPNTAVSAEFQVAAFENIQNTPARIHIEYTEPVIPTAPTPQAFITGSILAANEDDIRVGGDTLVITLQSAFWPLPGATFDAIRQDIIDGITSAGVQATGWNIEVRDNIPVGSVVRTDFFTVTVTLPASTSYNISIPETITVTVPDVSLLIPQVVIPLTFDALGIFDDGAPDIIIPLTFAAVSVFSDGAPDILITLGMLCTGVFDDGTPDVILPMGFAANFVLTIVVPLLKSTTSLQPPATADDITVRDSPVPTFASSAPATISTSLASQLNTRTGLRFDMVPVKKGNTVTRARITWSPIGSPAGTIDSFIQGELAANAAQITSLADYVSRVRTVESIQYLEPPWSNNVDIVSRDFSKVIQEIVDQATWAQLNALNLFWEPVTGALNVERTADSSDTTSADRPKLFIEFLEDIFSIRVDAQIAASADDVSLEVDAVVFSTVKTELSAGDTDDLLVDRESTGMRFDNLVIPNAAVITCAYITWIPASSKAGLVTRTILKVALEDDSAQIISAGDYTGRPKSVGVTYDPPAWILNEEEQSPDIRSEIQQVVDRVGWASGNAINVFWEDNGSDDPGADMFREAKSRDLSAAEAPKLTIFYQTAPPPSGDDWTYPITYPATFVP